MWFSSSRDTNQPNFQSTTALWDTGATGTGIANSLAQSLGLIPVGKTEVKGSGGAHTSDVFLIDVRLPNGVEFQGFPACEVFLEPPLGLLIGMDIITLGDLVITNENRRTVFSFRVPSRGPPIDFVQEINRLAKRPGNLGKKPKHGRKRR